MNLRTSILALLLLTGSFAFAGMDAQFLNEMTMHHQMAVKMAKMAEKKLSAPQVKKMNRKIIEDQKKDIARMQSWKKEVGPSTESSNDMQMGMDMPMDMDMSAMKDLKGKDFDSKYLEMMSAHHSQAVSMVQKYLAELKNPKVKSFAEKTAKMQESEIEKMSKMKEDIANK